MRTLTFLLLALALTFVTSCKDDDTVYNTAADAGFSVGNWTSGATGSGSVTMD